MAQRGVRPGASEMQLHEYCRRNGIAAPNFQEASDRRGSRTAWTVAVTVDDQVFRARYFYDGDHISSAREDAAQVALIGLGAVQAPAPAQHMADIQQQTLQQQQQQQQQLMQQRLLLEQQRRQQQYDQSQQPRPGDGSRR